MWAYAREGSSKEQMRSCFEDQASRRESNYAQQLHERFSEEKMYESFIKAMGFTGISIEQDYVFVSDMFREQFIGGAELSLQTLIDSIPESKTSACVNSSNVSEYMLSSNKDKTWIFKSLFLLQPKISQIIISLSMIISIVNIEIQFFMSSSKMRSVNIVRLREEK
jgi:hypothetical protein